MEKTIKFWQEARVLEEISLKSHALTQLSDVDLNLRVVDMLQPSGVWNRNGNAAGAGKK